MSRPKGSPEYGTYCDCCGRITTQKERHKISSVIYIEDIDRPNIRTHKTKTEKSFGLCKSCYEKYEQFLKSFLRAAGGK